MAFHFVCSYNHLYISSYICLFTNSVVFSSKYFVPSFILLIYRFAHSFCDLFVFWDLLMLIHLFICLLVCLFRCSLFCSFIHLLSFKQGDCLLSPKQGVSTNLSSKMIGRLLQSPSMSRHSTGSGGIRSR